MKTKPILIASLLVLLMGFTFSPIAAQQQSTTANEQIIENKVRINELEKNQQQIQIEYNQKLSSIEEKLQVKNENLEYKNNWISWWLAALGILITFFGVFVPIAFFYYSRKFTKDIDKQKEKVKSELNLFKIDFQNRLNQLIDESKDRITLLEEKAQLCIKHLEKNVKEGDDAITKLSINVGISEEWKKNFTNKELSEKDKNVAAFKANEIVKDEKLSQFDRDMAKAMELYFSDNDKDAKELFFNIIKLYPHEITLEKLADLYFYIAYIYYLEKNYSKSVEFYEQTLKYIPNHYDAWFCLAMCYGDVSDFENSIRCYKEAISLDDMNQDAYANLIEILLFEKEFSEAETYIEKFKSSFQENSFDKIWLEILFLKFTNNWNKNELQTFADIKEKLNNDPTKLVWVFDDLITWLDSSKSDFLSQKQKKFVSDLIQILVKWNETSENE